MATVLLLLQSISPSPCLAAIAICPLRLCLPHPDAAPRSSSSALQWSAVLWDPEPAERYEWRNASPEHSRGSSRSLSQLRIYEAHIGTSISRGRVGGRRNWASFRDFTEQVRWVTRPVWMLL